MRFELTDFAGEWQIRRRIEDRHAGQEGRFEGVARLAADGVWHETGTLEIGGARFPAERRYLWSEAEEGIAVAFADGRPFHQFSADAPEAVHWCAPDDYRVCYDFTRWPVWRAEWRVSGPRKDYTMRSEYSRVGP